MPFFLLITQASRQERREIIVFSIRSEIRRQDYYRTRPQCSQGCRQPAPEAEKGGKSRGLSSTDLWIRSVCFYGIRGMAREPDFSGPSRVFRLFQQGDLCVAPTAVPQIPVVFQIEPQGRASAEGIPDRQCGIGRNSSAPVYDLIQMVTFLMSDPSA
jgi:hypothetical protein